MRTKKEHEEYVKDLDAKAKTQIEYSNGLVKALINAYNQHSKVHGKPESDFVAEMCLNSVREYITGDIHGDPFGIKERADKRHGIA